MTIDWWSLPGPRRLVGGVSAEIRLGKNVVLAVPDRFPIGFRKAVRESRELRDLHWHCLTVSDGSGRHPLDRLWEEFTFSDAYPDQPRSIEELLSREELGGTIVWVDGFQKSEASTLAAFLERFSHALNAIPVYRRLQVCFVVPLSILASFAPGVCCAVIDSSSYVGQIDALTYSTALIRDKPFRFLEAQVAASVLASIALWDEELASALAEQPLETMLAPLTWLKTWGRVHGWDENMTGDELRYTGLLSIFDGQPRLHSAVTAMRGDTGEICRRVWRGQAGVLLPFIEERRRDLLEFLCKLIVLPYRTQFLEITDINELEIGHLYAMFGRGYLIDSDVRALIRVLRDMRNRLAHFCPVDYGVLAGREMSTFQSVLRTSRRP